MFMFNTGADVVTQTHEALMQDIAEFRDGWAALRHESNAKYHDQGALLLDALLDEPGRVRPFPGGVYHAVTESPHFNETLLAMRDLKARQKKSDRHTTLARMIASMTPSSMPLVTHKVESDIKATADGLGMVNIKLPLDDDAFHPTRLFGDRHDVKIGSTFMPGCHVTKWHSDYSCGGTTVRHMTGKKIWLVCPYSPDSAPTLLDYSTRLHSGQDVAAVFRALPFVYVAIISEPTAFVLSPLDHHAVLTLTPSHHCGGKVLLRDERGLFWMAQDYWCRLLKLSMSNGEEGTVERATKELKTVTGVLEEYMGLFGDDRAFAPSDIWGRTGFSRGFLKACSIEISRVPKEYR